MGPLQQLWDYGQSFWLDNLSREMLRDGKLARRVEEDGLRGVTSNPAIFHKAITEGEEYDEDIARFAAEGLSVLEVYDRLTIADVQAACDVLHGVWQSSNGVDGYVSLEVSPHLAGDTDGTVLEARRLHDAVSRDNVLIKIPGTPEGVPAIRQSLFEGVNVNVTLLFSRSAYEEVADAYLEALEMRLEAGRRIDGVASVASFFLSRIDVLVDKQLEALAASADEEAAADIETLFGQAAVSNAKLAYRSFREQLAGERWTRLASEGARPQRMLWASTSSKNAAYSDVKYVESLIGDLTINTLPEKTIAAFQDHGTVADTVADGMDEAQAVMQRLADAGIDFEGATRQLLAEGVEKFVIPFDQLLESLGEEMRPLTASGTA